MGRRRQHPCRSRQSSRSGRAHAKNAEIVKDSGWRQAEAPARCGVTQPRVNDLLRGRVSRFSIDSLFNIATALGRRVHVEIGAA